MLKKFSIFVLIFAAFTFASFAQDSENTAVEESSEALEEVAAEEGGSAKKIGEIKFSGLKKTKEKYLLRVLKDFEGKEASEENLKEIEGALMREQLFEKIAIKSSDSGESASLEIEVKEKISFLPLPFGAVSNGRAMIGAFLMDTNAFGVKDVFVLGGLYSPSTLSGFALYSKSAVDITHPGFSVSLSASKSKSKIADENQNELFEYKHKSFGGSLSLHEKLSKYVTLNAGCAYLHMDADDIDEEYAAWGATHFAIEKLQTISPNVSLAVGTTDWNGIFLSQKSFGIGGALLFTDYNDEGWKKSKSASAKLVFQQPLLSEKLRFLLSSSAYWSADAPITARQGGGAVDVTILAENYTTDKIAGGNTGFEYALFTTKIGTFSGYALYECAISNNFSDEAVFSQGAHGGMKLYLSKIAIPALSFGLSYNASQKFWNTSFAFGMQF